MSRSRSLSAWCVDHPIATVLLTFALVLLGLIAFPRLPIAPLPEAEFPTIQVSAATGTIKVKAQFDNPTHTLWPGQLVNIEIQTGLEQRALVVPPQVVQRGLDNYFVYRTAGDSVETVPVQMIYQDTTLNVISGVNVGDTLVSDGQSRLKPGSRITVLSEPGLTDAPVQP